MWAQGSGSSAPEPRTGGGLSEIPFVVTRTADATILEITERVMVVREVDRKGRERIHELRIDAKLSVRADKKTEQGQTKKKLSVMDLMAGQMVRVTWRADDQWAMEVKVIPEKKA
jgi:hypothetical protein